MRGGVPHSLTLFGSSSPTSRWPRIAPPGSPHHVRTILASESAEAVQEAATFWLHHRNLRPAQKLRDRPRQMARDVARGARESAAFRLIASDG